MLFIIQYFYIFSIRDVIIELNINLTFTETLSDKRDTNESNFTWEYKEEYKNI